MNQKPVLLRCPFLGPKKIPFRPAHYSNGFVAFPKGYDHAVINRCIQILLRILHGDIKPGIGKPLLRKTRQTRKIAFTGVLDIKNKTLLPSNTWMPRSGCHRSHAEWSSNPRQVHYQCHRNRQRPSQPPSGWNWLPRLNLPPCPHAKPRMSE